MTTNDEVRGVARWGICSDWEDFCIRKMDDGEYVEYEDYAEAIQQLQTEVERLREDAERYRFIAADHGAAWEEELDAAIDAARAAHAD